jgi:SAM-dependent methyltransferase
VRDDLVARLALELESFRSRWEEPANRARLIPGALPRIAIALDLLPPATSSSRLLELGSEPFLGSQCLDLVWPGTVTHANYYGTGERHGSETLIEVGGTRTKTYDYDLFNVETDEFPYPDATFDVVLFAELIEHLAINPVWALAEIHRVLKPDGRLILTTPNALSVERLETLVTGWRPDVDRYNPVFGYGARHNREFAAWELELLLDETGFDVERTIVRDLPNTTRRTRVRRALLRALLRPFSRIARGSNIFLRARRRPVFRWRFPDALFSEGRLYHVLRHPWVEMGVNDAIQCDEGWEPPEEVPGTGWVRRVRGVDGPLPGASAGLLGLPGASHVVVEVRAPDGASETPVRIAVAETGPARAVIGLTSAVAPSGRWGHVEVALARPAVAGEHLNVNVAVEPGREVAVRKIALAGDRDRDASFEV